MKDLDQLFKTAILKDSVEPPSLYFEDQIMNQIEVLDFKRKNAHQSQKLSLLFFTLGTVFGLAFSISLPYLNLVELGEESSVLIWCLQAGFLGLLLGAAIYFKRKLYKPQIG